jgi:NAD(P)-dependent dehydrogenase (short-subunit alcohol dehydrogenase family)
MTAPAGKTALIIGASRGLGYALAAEYLARGWRVTATVRGTGRTGLHDLARSSAGRLVVETVDITVPEQVAALHERLAQATFDLPFVNAAASPHATPTTRTLLLMAPSWVQTDLGGPAARRAIAGACVPDAHAMRIIARRTRIEPCLPRRTICCRCPS